MAITPQTLSRLQQITNEQWSTILKQLIIYAELRLDKIGFEPRSEIDGVTGQDFAMDAITKVFEGQRKWDFEKYPDLLIHLKLVVKSLIWNHIKSSAKVVVQTREITFAEKDNLFGDEDSQDEDFVHGDTPEEILVTHEKWQQIETAFGDDADGFIFFCDWLDEKPPRKIAEEYGIAVTEINKTIKKGKRIIKKVFSQ